MQQIVTKIFELMSNPRAPVAALGLTLFVGIMASVALTFSVIGIILIHTVFLISKISGWLAVAYVISIVYTSAYAVIYWSGKP